MSVRERERERERVSERIYAHLSMCVHTFALHRCEGNLTVIIN